MTDIWSFLLQTFTASGVAALLLIIKALFRDKLSPRWQFAVWGILGIMLLVPAGFRGRYVLLNWPLLVETLKSILTGRFGTLTRVAAPLPLPAISPPRTLWDWLYLVYAGGVILLLTRYAIAYVRLRRLLKRGRSAKAEGLNAVAEKYGLPLCPAVEVEGLSSAFVCGVFRPVLALPAGAEPEEKVLLHELLHLKYRDAVWGLAICFFRCIHWCNPLLWHCANLAGNDLETLCDWRVLERLEGEERRDYGRILLDMTDEKYANLPGTSSMANGGGNIRRRIEAIARFKRYPAGMGLVSVCVALVLICPLLAGAQTKTLTGSENPYVRMASARTTWCTTFAGAFDTYAKAVVTDRADYRAMCAPLSDQDELAGLWSLTLTEGESFQGTPAFVKKWGSWLDQEISWKDRVDRSRGYQIFNLIRRENGWEGLLVLYLRIPPKERTWSGTDSDRWLMTQPLFAQKEEGRWVVHPQGELQAVQGDIRDGGILELPALEYEAQAGDFLLRARCQTAAYVDSYQEETRFGLPDFDIVFDTVPVPDGNFTGWSYQTLTAEYLGTEEGKKNYQSIGIACKPLWGDEGRSDLTETGAAGEFAEKFGGGGSYSNSNGEQWASRPLDGNWENTIYLTGLEGTDVFPIDPPDRYAAAFYLNEKKVGEFTLLPVTDPLDQDRQ